MPDDTPTPAPTILSEVAPSNPNPAPAPTPEPGGGSQAPQRPAYVPEKFWDATKGAADVEKLGASYQSLEAKLGQRTTLTPPLPGDPPEKVEAFNAELRKLTGAPEKPEGYEIKAPEKLPEGIKWDEEGAGKLAALAHKYALPKGAVADILALQQERMGLMASNAMQTMEQQKAAGRAELEKAWGKENFNANAQAAVKAAQALGVAKVNPATGRVDIDPEVGNNPLFIKAMYQASLLMREDKMIGSGDGTNKTNEELIAEIRRSPAYNDASNPAAQQAAQNRIALLSGVAVGQARW